MRATVSPRADFLLARSPPAPTKGRRYDCSPTPVEDVALRYLREESRYDVLGAPCPAGESLKGLWNKTFAKAAGDLNSRSPVPVSGCEREDDASVDEQRRNKTPYRRREDPRRAGSYQERLRRVLWEFCPREPEKHREEATQRAEQHRGRERPRSSITRQ